MKLVGNSILITGGSSGIGLALGMALLERGNEVVLLARNQQKLAPLERLGFKIICCDLANAAEIEAASIEIQNRFPRLNILFNNAGLQYNYDFSRDVFPINKIPHEIQVNLSGQIMLSQLLLPLLMTADKAWIVNTTSGLAYFPKNDGLVYSASKAGFQNFTMGLKYLLKGSTIKVLEMIPPVTETAMTEGRKGPKMSPEEYVLNILPQLEKEQDRLTVRQIRLFRWIAFHMPKIAYRILNKNHD